MELRLGVLDYVVIVLMLAISAAVGIYFHLTGGRQKTTQEFLMAGKSMSVLPVAFSLMATYMSAISLMGVPAEIYMYGTQSVAWSVGIPAGAFIASRMFLPIFYEMEACTAYEYLERRFGKLMRCIISMLFILQTVLYMSVVLYAPSLALNAVTGLSTWTSVIALALVCIFYCSLGGLKAVLWTDVFQSLLMFTTLIAVIVKVSLHLGGMSNAMDIANQGGRLIFTETRFDLVTRYTLWNCLLNGAFFAVSTFGTNQAQIQRILSVGTLKKGQSALFYGIPLIMIFSIFCSWDGVMIYSLFHDCDPILSPSNSTISSMDQLVPFAIMTMFAEIPGLSGLCICGIFSASLSTISSALNSLTAVTMEDFIRPYVLCKKLTDAWATFLAKMIGIAYGCICLILTIVVANFRGVSEASGVLFGMFGGPVLGVFTLGMLTTTANEQGTLFGLLVGFAISAWVGFSSYVDKVKIPSLPRSVTGCAMEDAPATLGNLSRYDSLISQNDETASVISRISFMWFHVFGTLAVLLVGYVASYMMGCYFGRKRVRKSLISPALRKWYFSEDETKDQSETISLDYVKR